MTSKQPEASAVQKEPPAVQKEPSAVQKEPSAVQKMIGDFAPKLVELTDHVLFGDIWERPGLSQRDRSLITVSALIAMNRTEQVPFHLRKALGNGVTKDELIEIVTHLAFYAGWPNAMSAIMIAKSVFAESA
jgi:4-carboxymuconolactone decarboxylase